MGYRWYHAHGVTPAFAFGHGLSYTQFALGGLTVSGSTVSFSVRNTGAVAGSAVAQLYLTFPSSAGEPPKQLKRFEKVAVAPGEEHSVRFTLEERDFSIWETASHGWKKVSGTFGVSVGQASDDAMALTGSLVVGGDIVEA